MLSKIGRISIGSLERAGSYSKLVGQTLAACFARPFEWRELSKQLETVGILSFPVVAVTSIFTGMVFSLQTYEGFRRFQAEGYVPGVLGLALLREMVPVLGSMMVAGRVGSAMAAELGTMKVTHQIDALEVMATDPVRFLVVPRFLATLIMLPFLITLGDLIGIGGGWYLITQVLESPTPGFLDRVFDYLDAMDYWSGVIKAVVFGGIIASVGCYQGLSTRGGAEGVGRATTRAVVNGCLGILISDFFLSKVLF